MFDKDSSSGSRHMRGESSASAFDMSEVSSLIAYYIVYRYYYQHKPERMSTCPVTIHALLHIADSIEKTGPVWASWAFPMERFCGSLQGTIGSWRFPWASIDRRLLDVAQLTQAQLIYNMPELSLRPRRHVLRDENEPSRIEVKLPDCEQFHIVHHTIC